MEFGPVQQAKVGAGYVLDENAKRCCAEAQQLLLQYQEELYTRNTAKAIAEGFSSMEAKVQHSMDEFDKAEMRHEQWMKEQAALANKTFEEFESEYWAPQRFVPRPIHSPLPDCSCEDHSIPFFCAKSLVEYNSQKQEEQLPDFITNRRHPRLDELQIDPRDPSKRLACASLEKEWARTPPKSCDLPTWAKGDMILQQIIQSSSPPSSHGVSGCGGSVPSLASTMTEHEASSITTPTELSYDTEHEVREAFRLFGSRKTRLQPGLRNTSKQRRRKPLHKSHQGPDRISNVLERCMPPATWTRSQNVMNFYELGQDGALLRS